jgi:simple sugar transport system permease protein
MLLASLTGFVASYYSDSALVGTLAGVLTGILASLFLGWIYISVRASQVVVGFIFNIFVFGLTTLGYRVAFGLTTVAPQARIFSAIAIPILSDIPFVGPVFFEHHILVYITGPLVVAFGVLLYRTKLGLTIRAVGEHPRAADTAGIKVSRIRYICMAIAGGMQGLAGASLVLGQLGIFRDNVTAGRGFIALAIVIFGRWNPYIALGAAFVFGAADALAMSLQLVGSPIPPQFLLMLPYVVASVAMSGLVGGKIFAPACLGQSYERE